MNKKCGGILFCLVLIIQLVQNPAIGESIELEELLTFSATGSYLAARQAEVKKDLSLAANFLKLVLREDPRSIDLLRRTFLILMLEGRHAEALEIGEKISEKNSKFYITNLLLVVREIQLGNFRGAEKLLKNMSTTGIGSIATPLLQAWTLFGQDKLDEAQVILSNSKKDDSHKILFEFHKGLMLEVKGQHAKAIEIFENLLKQKQGSNFRLVQLVGNFYELKDKTIKAQSLYKKFRDEGKIKNGLLLEKLKARILEDEKPEAMVSNIKDGVAEVLFSIANLLRLQKSGEMALIFGRLSLFLKPNFPIMRVMVGEIMEEEGRLLEANKMYQKIGSNSVFKKGRNIRIAANLHELNKTDEAIEILRKVAIENPKDPEPLVKIGDYLRSREEFSKAADEYNFALKRVGPLKPRHWRLLYIRGIALERVNDWVAAEKDLLKALELKPNQPYVLNYLGYSYLEQGVKLKSALNMIKKAVKIRPTDGYIIDSLGWGYYRLGSYLNAVKELERAVLYRPEDPVINDHLGDAYWQVGRKTEAAFQWRRALSLEPNEDLEKSVSKKLESGLEILSQEDKK